MSSRLRSYAWRASSHSSEFWCRRLIADRTTEHLSYSDRGIAFFCKLTKEQIERVQQGLDPMGLVRDPDHMMIDTNIDESTKVEIGDRPVGIVAATMGRSI